MPDRAPDRSLRERVDANPLWYHTLELAPGIVTPGWFDLRPTVDRLPWPEVSGRRCLDIGTYDGFFAFELERRGASEVIATDIADHTEWDWAPEARAQGPERLAAIAGPQKGLGFEIAKQALGSAARRLEISVYDLSPERVGTFDVVVCGALLLHLRDPIRALEAIRGVCAGQLLSAEAVDRSLSRAHRRRPVARLDALAGRGQWWIPNAAGHRRMLFAAGFEIERASGLYVTPFGPAHRAEPGSRGRRWRRLTPGAIGRGRGVRYSALLARPRF